MNRVSSPALPDGLSAFPITPADQAGRVDAAALGRLVGRLRDARVDSIGVLGSTGGYAYLDRAERRGALDAAMAEAGDVPVLAGVGALRTDAAVALAEDARVAGASAGLLAPMSYAPLTPDEVFEHYRAVARVGLPIVIYDNPGTTHFTFTPDLVARLAQGDGIVAVKSPTTTPDAVTPHLADLRARVPAPFSLGYSGDWNCAEAMIAGADSWYSVFAGLFPHEALAITRAACADPAECRRLNARLEPLWALFQELSSFRIMYAAANAMGLTDAQPPRPVLPLGKADRTRVEAVMADLDLT